MNWVEIGNRKIGPGSPCFIIAEAGVNHNGELDIALQMIDVAVQAGANAVKFQTFKAEKIVTMNAPKAEYQLKATNSKESQFSMLKRLELSREDHKYLMSYCRKKGILFMSTPFDEESADFLNELGVKAFKISSGEIINTPFLTHVARKDKPLVVSTGMASLGEVATAVETIKKSGNKSLVLLHCVSNYPANPEDINLNAMQTMAKAFGLPVGYSDHTLGIEIAIAAVALGACVLEKHFTLDSSLPGPDHQASIEPDELKILIQGIRKVEVALGNGHKEPVASEAITATVARKSLVAERDIPAGTILSEKLVSAKRPGTGIPPSMKYCLMGRTMKVPVSAGTLITWEMLV